LSDVWHGSVEAAIATMLRKSRRDMQRGLADFAQGVIDLVSGATCGDLAAFAKLKDQATRLKVFATSRSLGQLDAKVKYEPLKVLMVGGVDVHAELNAVIIAWQLKKGAEAFGQALAMFLRDFASDAAGDAADAPAGAPPGAAPREGVAPTTPVGQRTAGYWAEALNEAFKRLGDGSAPTNEQCLGEELAQRSGDLVAAAFEDMMQKTRWGMQKGLRRIADGTARLLADLDVACGASRASPGLLRLRSAAARLQVLSVAKNLVNPGIHVDYEPLKALKVGGIDVHVELNLLIKAWINEEGAASFGKALALFFEDFQEQVEAPETDSGSDSDRMRRMIEEALEAAAKAADQVAPALGEGCFSAESMAAFVPGVDGAIEHMLQKKKRTMQQGLKELADVVDRLLAAQPGGCTAGAGARVLWSGARKLQRITRKLAVDYGTHIRYEAMKSLIVGGVAVHSELNNFLAAWKLNSPDQAGPPFGQLMHRVGTARGYGDEL